MARAASRAGHAAEWSQARAASRALWAQAVRHATALIDAEFAYRIAMLGLTVPAHERAARYQALMAERKMALDAARTSVQRTRLSHWQRTRSELTGRRTAARLRSAAHVQPRRPLRRAAGSKMRRHRIVHCEGMAWSR